jgi:hypothetical protein
MSEHVSSKKRRLGSTPYEDCIPACPVCYMGFHEGSPIVLGCRHDLCAACLKGLLKRPDATCPVCRTRVSPASIDDFKVNSGLMAFCVVMSSKMKKRPVREHGGAPAASFVNTMLAHKPREAGPIVPYEAALELDSLTVEAMRRRGVHGLSHDVIFTSDLGFHATMGGLDERGAATVRVESRSIRGLVVTISARPEVVRSAYSAGAWVPLRRNPFELQSSRKLVDFAIACLGGRVGTFDPLEIDCSINREVVERALIECCELSVSADSLVEVMLLKHYLNLCEVEGFWRYGDDPGLEKLCNVGKIIEVRWLEFGAYNVKCSFELLLCCALRARRIFPDKGGIADDVKRSSRDEVRLYRGFCFNGFGSASPEKRSWVVAKDSGQPVKLNDASMRRFIIENSGRNITFSDLVNGTSTCWAYSEEEAFDYAGGDWESCSTLEMSSSKALELLDSRSAEDGSFTVDGFVCEIAIPAFCAIGSIYGSGDDEVLLPAMEKYTVRIFIVKVSLKGQDYAIIPKDAQSRVTFVIPDLSSLIVHDCPCKCGAGVEWACGAVQGSAVSACLKARITLDERATAKILEKGPRLSLRKGFFLSNKGMGIHVTSPRPHGSADAHKILLDIEGDEVVANCAVSVKRELVARAYLLGHWRPLSSVYSLALSREVSRMKTIVDATRGLGTEEEFKKICESHYDGHAESVLIKHWLNVSTSNASGAAVSALNAVGEYIYSNSSNWSFTSTYSHQAMICLAKYCENLYGQSRVPGYFGDDKLEIYRGFMAPSEREVTEKRWSVELGTKLTNVEMLFKLTRRSDDNTLRRFEDLPGRSTVAWSMSEPEAAVFALGGSLEYGKMPRDQLEDSTNRFCLHGFILSVTIVPRESAIGLLVTPEWRSLIMPRMREYSPSISSVFVRDAETGQIFKVVDFIK